LEVTLLEATEPFYHNKFAANVEEMFFCLSNGRTTAHSIPNPPGSRVSYLEGRKAGRPEGRKAGRPALAGLTAGRLPGTMIDAFASLLASVS
jgi:hypothetical protein